MSVFCIVLLLPHAGYATKCNNSFLPQVNMDEDAGEEEMEWLMEELEAPTTASSLSSQRGRSHHGNGHITTKPVNTDGLRSFTLDDQEDDSEDEVLSVPGVRVVKPAGGSRSTAAQRSVFLQVSPTSGVGPAEDVVLCALVSAMARLQGHVRYSRLPAITRSGFQEESDEDLVGLLDESDKKTKCGKLRLSSITHGNSTAANRKREEDDSDEDLLRV